jgi:hypothetical protein
VLKLIRNILFPILAILAVIVIAYRQVAMFHYTMKWDMMDQFFSCRYFISECLNHGIFPLWNPYINFGYPAYADPQSATFYPITWVISLLFGYNAYSIEGEYVLHLVVAGLGMYKLLESFGVNKASAIIFGVAFPLSGIFVSNAQHLTWVISLAWLTWAVNYFYLTIQKQKAAYALLCGIALSLCLTGGYPAFIIIIAYLFAGYGLYALYREKEKRKNLFVLLGLTVAVFVSLSAGYLYSFTEGLGYISRGKPVTLADANSYPFSAFSFISFLLPFATAASKAPLHTDISMSNLYMGLLVFPFIATGFFVREIRNKLWLPVGLGVIMLLASLGELTPLRMILYKAVPGMNMFRHAGIFRTISDMCFIVSAGMSFYAIISNDEWYKKLKKVLLLFVAGEAFLIAAVMFYYMQQGAQLSFFNITSPSYIHAFNTFGSVGAHVLLQSVVQIGLLVVAIILLLIPMAANTRMVLLGLLVVVDLGLAVNLNTPATIISERSTASLNNRLQQMPKDFPVPLLAANQYTHFGDTSTAPMWYNVSMFRKQPAPNGFNSFRLSNMDALGDFDTLQAVIGRPVAHMEDTTKGTAVINIFQPGTVSVKTSCSAPAKLILLQSFYPGWKCTVNDKAVHIARVWYAFMEVEVPAGASDVKFTFNKPSAVYLFITEILLMITALIAAIVLLLRPLN